MLLLLLACTNADDPVPAGPPPICREPGPPPETWFENATDEAGLGDPATEALATSVVAADVDHDGWTDFYASVFPSQREPDPATRTRGLFLNRPDPADPTRRIFVDETEASGLLATRDGEGGRGLTTVTFGDLDNDGDLDAVGCAAEISTLFLDGCAAFLNDGAAHFTLADGGDLEADRFSVPTSVLLDYDRDGILDFFPGTIGEWQYGEAAVSPPRLFRGRGDGTFDDVSAEVGLPSDLSLPGDYRMNFGLTSCDVDRDGDRDVIVGNYGSPIGPNYLWRNDAGTFVNVADDLGVEDDGGGSGFTFSIACGDLDDDGDADLMTSEVAHPGQGTDVSAFLENVTEPGKKLAPFARRDLASLGMVRTEGEMEGDNIAIFEDLDLDGRKDVLLTSSNYPQQSDADVDYTHTWLWRQTAQLEFEDVTAKTPWNLPKQQTLEGAALTDYDRDGDLDVIVGKGLFNSTWIAAELGIDRPWVSVFRNDVGQDANVARIRVVGSGAGGSNRSGIGALVTVEAGGQVQHQEVLGSWGHSNTQNDVWLTFGLGEACALDTVTVRWPDAAASVTEHHDLRANYAIEIIEGEDHVRYSAITE